MWGNINKVVTSDKYLKTIEDTLQDIKKVMTDLRGIADDEYEDLKKEQRYSGFKDGVKTRKERAFSLGIFDKQARLAKKQHKELLESGQSSKFMDSAALATLGTVMNDGKSIFTEGLQEQLRQNKQIRNMMGYSASEMRGVSKELAGSTKELNKTLGKSVFGQEDINTGFITALETGVKESVAIALAPQFAMLTKVTGDLSTNDADAMVKLYQGKFGGEGALSAAADSAAIIRALGYSPEEHS